MNYRARGGERRESGREVVVARKARGRSGRSIILRLQEINKDLGKPFHLMYSMEMNLHATESFLETSMFESGKEIWTAHPATS